MKYKFEDIIYNITEKKKPTDEDRVNYIGLEHLDSDNFFIRRWGAERTPDGEKIVIKKGDVLFGKRRAYQRKVAISPVDGVFSAHGMVLRPKEDVIIKDFLPFFISSDAFLNEAIRISVGGLSPTINWKDIKVLEFNLPSLSEQKVLAAKLWAAYKVKQSYLEMIEAIDELVKSRFISQFGNLLPNHTIGEVAEVYDGTHQTPNYVNEGIRFVSVEDINDLYNSTKFISEADYQKYKHVPTVGDIIMTRIGSIGKCAIVDRDEPLAYYVSVSLLKLNHDKIDSRYLKYYLESDFGDKELKLRSLLKAFPMKINLKEIPQVRLILPEIAEQIKFVDLVKQADKSKVELRKSLDAINKVIKSLINENL